MQTKKSNANLWLLLAGQGFSLLGNNALTLALSLYVLDLTGSAAVFAGLLAAATLPTVLLSPLGGALADRLDRRKLMAGLDGSLGLLTLLATPFLLGKHPVAAVAVVLVAFATLEAFETPTVQACLPQLFEGEALLKANAAVSQCGAVAGLIAPLIGSALYAAFGLLPVLLGSGVCFLLTAVLEWQLKLPKVPQATSGPLLPTLLGDLAQSARFVFKEQPQVAKLLFLAAAANLFVMGCVGVGLPYLVHTVYQLGATYYGGLQSGLGLMAILGSVLAALLAGKLPFGRLWVCFSAMGLGLVGAGACLMAGAGPLAAFWALAAMGVVMQLAACVFSVFAITELQTITPTALTGKVMAFSITFSLCAQPLGQGMYGALFEALAPGLVLVGSGVAVVLLGFAARPFLRRFKGENA